LNTVKILLILDRKERYVILTTHDLEDVSELCKRLIVINHCKVVEDGPIEEIISKMAGRRMMVLDLANPSKFFKDRQSRTYQD
jgi:ABC-type uncharacterized transport system ATPase subunit